MLLTKIDKKWRVLHVISGLFYAVPAYTIYKKDRKFGSALYVMLTVLSILWSATSNMIIRKIGALD